MLMRLMLTNSQSDSCLGNYFSLTYVIFNCTAETPSAAILTAVLAVDEQRVEFTIKRPSVASRCVTSYLINSTIINRIEGTSSTITVVPDDRDGLEPVVTVEEGFNLCSYAYSFSVTPVSNGVKGKTSGTVHLDFFSKTFTSEFYPIATLSSIIIKRQCPSLIFCVHFFAMQRLTGS